MKQSRRYKEIKAWILESKVRLALLISFFFLMTFQIYIGFTSFDDYLLVFIFILFLNDQFLKMNHDHEAIETTLNMRKRDNKQIRLVITFFIIGLILISLGLDAFHVSEAIIYIVYKGGLIIWAQIFLIDSFLHYKETHSKKWLIFTNTALAMTLFGAFII